MRSKPVREGISFRQQIVGKGTQIFSFPYEWTNIHPRLAEEQSVAILDSLKNLSCMKYATKVSY